MSGRATRSTAQQGKATGSNAGPTKRGRRAPQQTAAKQARAEVVENTDSHARRTAGAGIRDGRHGGGRDRSASDESTGAIVVQQPVSLESPGAFSGTTARTSMNSNRRQSNATPNELIDNLGRLDDAAVQMVDQLTSEQGSAEALARIYRNFRDDQRVAGRMLRDSRLKFRNVRAIYTQHPYINVEQTVAATLALPEGESPSQGPWRPDDILFHANLAIAAEDVQLLREETGDYNLNFEKLTRDFPEPFLRAIGPASKARAPCGASSMLKETFLMALEIRVQYAIRILVDKPVPSARDPESVLREIFYNDSTLRGWDVEGLRREDLTQPQKREILTVLETLTSAIDEVGDGRKDGEAGDLKPLELKYPKEDFVGRYLKWIHHRSSEIDTRLKSVVGKVIGVQEALEQYFEQRNVGTHAVAQDPGSKIPTRESLDETAELSPARRAALSDQLHRMRPGGKGKAWKNVFQQAEQAAATASPRTAPNEPSKLRQSITTSPDQAQASRRAHLDQAATGLSPAQVTSMVSRVRHDQTEANKENAGPTGQLSTKSPPKGRSFIDAQATAQRIPFDTQANDLSEPFFSEPDDALEIPSQDTGFEQDTRGVSNKRSAPTARERPGAKKVRMAHTEEAIPSSSENRFPESSSRAHNYIEANLAAKARTLVHSSQRPAQQRKPWTQEETTYLIEAIETVGTSWSRIKDADKNGQKRLIQRDQVALKDKARNLLFDYLKAGQELPANFNKVKLNASQKNQLRELNIPFPDEFNRLG